MEMIGQLHALATLPSRKKTLVPTEKQLKLHDLLLDCMTLEDGADRLYRNISNLLPNNTVFISQNNKYQVRLVTNAAYEHRLE